MNPRRETRFEEPGTLPEPGWLGRLVRLLLGLGVLNLFYQLASAQFGGEPASADFVSGDPPRGVAFWGLVLILFWILPYVVDLGLGVDWGRWSQAVLGALLAGGVVWSLSRHGSFWSEPVAWIALLWILYESLHLGMSFLLAGILATPGCEMRAIPDLVARLRGGRAREHVCPGFLDSLDRWERSWGSGS